MKKVMCFLMTALMVMAAVSCDKTLENDDPGGPDGPVGPDNPELPQEDYPYVLSDLHIGEATFPIQTLTKRHAAGFVGYIGTDKFLYAEDIDEIPTNYTFYPLCVLLGDKSLQEVYDKVDDRWGISLLVITDREFDAKDYTFFDAIPVGILPESALETIQGALQVEGNVQYFEGEVICRQDKVSPAKDFRDKQWLATSVYGCDSSLYDFGVTEDGKFVYANNYTKNWDSGFYAINDQRAYKAPVIPDELTYPDTWRHPLTEGASETELILSDKDIHFKCLYSVGDYLIVDWREYDEEGTLKDEVIFVFEPLKKTVKMTQYFSYGVMVSARGKDYPMWCQHAEFNSAFLAMGSDVPFCYLDAFGKQEDFVGKDVSGKVVGILRGELPFAVKQENAKNAGAIGVIIINDEEEALTPTADKLSIPLGLVKLSVGKALKKATTVSFVPSHEFVEGGEEEEDLIVQCTTTEVSDVTTESACLHGRTVIAGNEDGAVSAYFYYSTTSGDAAALKASGQKVVAGNMPPMGGDFEANISSLLPATTYYFVAGVTIGTIEKFGSVMSFTTEEPVQTGPKAIDLGIVIHRADGTAYKLLWAEYNVGATSPEDGGDYYAWGETDYYYLDGHRYDNPLASWNYKDGKSGGYAWGNYKWSASANMKFTKYCLTDDQANRWGGSGSPDGKTVLELEDDAARAVFGEGWRMPTAKEFEALAWWCNHEWTTQNGVYGMKITSTVNNQSIFLPAVGYRSANSLWHNNEGEGYEGYYWTSSINGKDALYGSIVYLNHETAERCFLPFQLADFNRYERYWGMQVRAVKTEETQPITSSHMGHEFVDMGNGIKMAKTNIGAEYEDSPGEYFAWGEVVTNKSNYSWSTYRYYENNQITRYVAAYSTGGGFEVINLYPEDDAAHVKWGGCWRTPTAAEWQTLTDKNKYQWDWEESGFRVTCRANNNSIFLPAAGVKMEYTLMNKGSAANYWAAGTFDRDSKKITCLSGSYTKIPGMDSPIISISTSSSDRCNGFPIRPVCDL